MNRQEKLLHRFNKDNVSMEIGPGYNPLLPKREGWQSISVDHADRAALVEKYRRFDVDVDAIEEVDVVWTGGALDKALPTSRLGTVNACVASHVIEHIPNPIMFFQSMSRILKPEGLLSLAIPDKRYCFDFFQSITGTGDWLHAWKRGAEIHSQRSMFQHIAYTVGTEGGTTWGQGRYLERFEFLSPSISQAFTRFQAYSENTGGTYQDCHAWHFTPSSFELLIVELSHLGLIPFSVEESYPTCGCEFIFLLRNTAPPALDVAELTQKRLQLLKNIVSEQGEQADQLRRKLLRSRMRRLAAWMSGKMGIRR